MSIRTLFTIILKVLGLFFAKDFILVIPQFVTILSFSFQSSGQTTSLLLAVLLTLACYSFVSYSLLFKTDVVINKFGLDQGFEVDAVRINIHRSTVLSLAVIIIGALMVINAVPVLLSYFIKYFQTASVKGLAEDVRFDWAYVLLYVLQIIIGLLALGHQQQVVNFIERKRRTNYFKAEDDGESSTSSDE